MKSAENGHEALKLIKNEDFDLIISDIIMPELGGIQLVNKLKELGIHKKIILMSSAPSDEIKDFDLMVECDGFLTKPFPISKLVDKIQSIISTESKLNQ